MFYARNLTLFLYIIVLLATAIRFIEPIRDGDLWWHLTYAKYMAEYKTLYIDNSVFNWNKDISTTYYCAWIGQKILYFIHTTLGLFGCYILKYIVLAAIAICTFHYAHKEKVLFFPITPLILLLVMLASYPSLSIKPELFSVLYMFLLTKIWFFIKQKNNISPFAFYILPIIILLWINTHGGFIFGYSFLLLICIGELINQAIDSTYKLTIKNHRHLLLSVTLVFPLLYLTPYGSEYINFLLKDIFLNENIWNEFNSVADYISPFSCVVHYLHMQSIFILIITVLITPIIHIYCRKRISLTEHIKNIDWSITIILLAFFAISLLYVRTVYLITPIFMFTSISLFSQYAKFFNQKRTFPLNLSNFLIALLIILFAARASYDSFINPFANRWFGFGISYQNPVAESHFIKNNLRGHLIANDYSTSGYLLWKLWPEKALFYAPPFFQTGKWYEEYKNFLFSGGKIHFQDSDKFDVVILSIRNSFAVLNFYKNPDWDLVFYGTSAVVFVRKNLAYYCKKGRESFTNIKNLNQAHKVLFFARCIKDFSAVNEITANLNRNR